MDATNPETVYLKSPVAVVTNARAVLNGGTYSMANITSVKTLQVNPDATWPLITLIAGALVLIFAGVVSNSPTGWLLGIALIIAGVWLLWRMQITYVVVIGSAGGEKHAMTSTRYSELPVIVDAISEAIVARG